MGRRAVGFGETIRAEKAAKRLNRWALSRTSSPNFARAYRVSASRARHWRTDDPDGPVERTLDALLTGDPEVATAIKDAVVAAWEHRALLSADTSTLISRWHYLWHTEPRFDADEDYQNGRWMGGADEEDHDGAMLRHGFTLIEMHAIRGELRARGVDTRAVLLTEPEAP